MLHREVSVSWATTPIVCPCPKFPITPRLLPLSNFFFFFPFIGRSQGSFLGKEDRLFHERPSLLLEAAFLLVDLKKKRSENILT